MKKLLLFVIMAVGAIGSLHAYCTIWACDQENALVHYPNINKQETCESKAWNEVSLTNKVVTFSTSSKANAKWVANDKIATLDFCNVA